jgi:uncharacterized FAD-dependent dehydrogenase
MEVYDIAIIGSGPAGMSAALEIKKLKPEAKTAIFEQGGVRLTIDRGKPEYATCGWGGAGAFSDGKLNLTWKSGGQLIDVISEEKFKELMRYVDEQYLEFGPASSVIKTPDEKKAKALKIEALAAGFKDFIYYPTRHWGTDTAYFIVDRIRHRLRSQNVEIFFRTKIADLENSGEEFLLKTEDSRQFKSRAVIMAGGRGSNEQTGKIAQSFGLTVEDNGVDIGVRIETLAECFEKFTDIIQSPKLIYKSKRNGKELRTFCVCPRGFVKLELSYGILTVNGESYSESSDIKSANTNFAILVHEEFTEPFKNSIGYGNKIASLANDLGKTVIVQTWSDFLKGRRSTPKRISESGVIPTLKEATPGSIGSVVPYDFMAAIEELIEEPLRKVAPAMNPDTILVYGGEVKQYAKKIIIDQNCESAKKRLYFIGDGSGWTRGILQASMQGIMSARHIAKEYL